MRNQSLATAAKSSLTPLVLAIGLFATLGASAGDPVYKWKDVQGHYHYAQSPPEGIKYETITASGEPSVSQLPLTGEPTAEPEPKKDTVAKADDSSNGTQTPAQIERQKLCTTAQANATTLNTHATVVGDVNGDGKPVTLNAKQHDAALENAKKQVDLYCTN
jgi:hypothetical protein